MGLHEDAEALLAEAERYLAQAAGSSPQAVEVSEWEKLMLSDLLGVHPELATFARGLREDVDYADDLLLDVFAYLWLERPRVRARQDVMITRWDNHKVITAMILSTQVEQLRVATIHDDFATGTAMVWLAESIRAWLKAREMDPEELAAQVEQAMSDLADAMEAGEGVAVAMAALEDLMEDQEASRPDLDTAAAEAGAELEEMSQLAGILGLTSSRGNSTGPGSGMASAQTWQLLRRLQRSGIAAYLAMIGRFMAVASAGVSAPSSVARGLELSDRVWDADAAELATRGHRLLRLEHLERAAAGELVTESFTGVPETEGPLVLVVDESQSMTETGAGGVSRVLWSKAFSLAMMQQARKAGREFVVISFADPDQVRVWSNPDAEETVAYLEHFFCGGTSYEEALDAALTVVETAPGMRAADMVLVTDDDRVDVDQRWLTGWRQRRDAVKPVPPRLRGVGVMAQPGAWLSRVADDVVLVTDFTSEAQVARAARTY